MPFPQLKENILVLLNKPGSTVDEKLSSICTLLREEVEYYDWVGFYFADKKTQTLHLRTFSGKETDHTTIPFGKGICGQVALSNSNFVVPDVNAQDNYIACSMDVKSEIVIPLFKDEENIGQIDIDSNSLDPFSQEDEEFLVWVNEQVSGIL
jgi:GAF domain-containing protein